MRTWCFQNSSTKIEDLVSKIYLSPPMASSIVCFKAVVLLLFIHYLLLLPLFVGVNC